jgi:hypothetical protein
MCLSRMVRGTRSRKGDSDESKKSLTYIRRNLRYFYIILGIIRQLRYNYKSGIHEFSYCFVLDCLRLINGK